MKDYLTTMLTVSISAGLLTLFLLGIRFVLKKTFAPKKWIAAFWILLAVRLLIPYSFSISSSPIPDPVRWIDGATTKTEQTNDDLTDVFPDHSPSSVHDPVASSSQNHVTAPSEITDSNESAQDVAASKNPGSSDSVNDDALQPLSSGPGAINLHIILIVLYAAGVVGMMTYFILSYFRLQRLVGEAIPLEGEENVFLSDRIGTAFVFGPLKQRIYLPIDVPSGYLNEVLLHERAHIQRKDPIWKTVGFFLLCFHWFNPFIWAAYLYFIRDIELACDEKAVQMTSEDEKRNYAKALLYFSGGKTSPALCQVAFGEVDLKERISALKKTKKHPAVISLLALILAVCLCACLFTKAAPAETIPEMRMLSDLTQEPAVLQFYQLSKDSYVQELSQPEFHLDWFLGQTNDAYCFTAYDARSRNKILFISKTDGSVLKLWDIPSSNGSWKTSSVELLDSGDLLVNQYIVEKIEDIGKVPRQRRIGLLNEDGTVKELFCYEEINSGTAPSFLKVTGSKLFYTEKNPDQTSIPEGMLDPAEISKLQNSISLKMMDIYTGKITVIRTDTEDEALRKAVLFPAEDEALKADIISELKQTGREIICQSYFISDIVSSGPDGFFYTVKTSYYSSQNDYDGYNPNLQLILYYYSFKTQKSSPALRSDAAEHYAYIPSYQHYYTGDPVWDKALGDLHQFFLCGDYPNDPSFLSCIDLENGRIYPISCDPIQEGITSLGRFGLSEVKMTGEHRYWLEAKINTMLCLLEADTSAQAYTAYRIPSDDPDAEAYLRLSLVDAKEKTALYLDQGSGIAYIYDLTRSVPVQQR